MTALLIHIHDSSKESRELTILCQCESTTLPLLLELAPIKNSLSQHESFTALQFSSSIGNSQYDRATRQGSWDQHVLRCMCLRWLQLTLSATARLSAHAELKRAYGTSISNERNVQRSAVKRAAAPDSVHVVRFQHVRTCKLKHRYALELGLFGASLRLFIHGLFIHGGS